MSAGGGASKSRQVATLAAREAALWAEVHQQQDEDAQADIGISGILQLPGPVSLRGLRPGLARNASDIAF